MYRQIKHVVMFSTGMSSAYLASLVLEKYGHEDTCLLFTDTKWEDEDNYRFMRDVSMYLGKEITWLADGRTPEQVFWDKRFFGNYATTPCSSELKMRQTVIFVENLRLNGYEPVLYFGITGETERERNRAPRIAETYSHNCIEPVESRFPLLDMEVNNVLLTQIIQGNWGIRRPRMYDLGFKHANCGGRCVKGGIGHYVNLHRVWPERFKKQAEMERRFRTEINDYTILKRAGSPFGIDELGKILDSQIKLDLPEDDEIPCACIF